MKDNVVFPLDPPPKKETHKLGPIRKFEHGILKIGEPGFEYSHWEALVKLNTLHGDKYFKVLHDGVQFRQYVGVIQVAGLVLEILPKADKGDTDEQWQGVLIPMLQACKRLRAHTPMDANLEKQPISLLEIYFEAFLRETELLIRQGLVKRYRRETGNVKALKGKLDFAGNIRHNLIHKERFYTVHQVYDVNHLLHQILNCALEIVEHFTAGKHLGDLCKRVQLGFPEVDRVRPTLEMLDSIQLDRKTADYERALELARLIILNYSPDISGGNEKMIALLFDMNKLWEEYVRIKLSEYLDEQPELDWEIISDSRMFWGSNYLKPDLILKSQKGTFIIDTKWKRPDRPSIHDLRQMYAYARFWKAERVMLLYPGNQCNSERQGFETDDYWLDETMENAVQIEHCCTMGFVSVLEGPKILDAKIGEKILGLMEVKF